MIHDEGYLWITIHLMNYQTYPPSADLNAMVKCHWTLEVPPLPEAPKQRIIPDGCIEMCFILGEDVRRYTTETEYILQPRAMVFGQITRPYFVQPTGYVNTFAVRFYPYGFANMIDQPISELADQETALASLFGKESAKVLEQKIIAATTTEQRIQAVEGFLLGRLADQGVQDTIVQSTVLALAKTKGKATIKALLKEDPSKRRSLERKFSKQVGISPKQLGKIIRLQAALKSMLNNQEETLTRIAYESDYYDQAHFIKDFKELTGTNPSDYLDDEQMMLSTLIYSKE